MVLSYFTPHRQTADAMLQFYPHLKHLHMLAVALSGLLFLARGIAVQLNARWAMAAPVRFTSYGIDTVLLLSAIALAALLGQYPFVHAWLTVKVLLLVVYIVLGVFALKRGRTRAIRLVCLLAALAVYAFIISVARTHHPLGFLL